MAFALHREPEALHEARREQMSVAQPDAGFAHFRGEILWGDPLEREADGRNPPVDAVLVADPINLGA